MIRKTNLFASMLVLLMSAQAASAETRTSQLLLPAFEVDLSGSGRTTYFALVNPSDGPAEVEVSLDSNWGIGVVTTRLELAAHETRTFNLADWLIDGELPDRVLAGEEAEHLRAALSGLPSPRGNAYYSSEREIGLALGSVTVFATGEGALFGDYFVLDPAGENAYGDLLLDVTAAAPARSPGCRRHGLRFMTGGALGVDTEVAIRARRPSLVSASSASGEPRRVYAGLSAYRQDGELLDVREASLLPLEILQISELGIEAGGGWLEILTAEETFVTVRYAAGGDFSLGFQAVCLAEELPEELAGAAIEVQGSVNGVASTFAPGLPVLAGSPLRWRYEITNSGGVDLANVDLFGNAAGEISCPRGELAAGASMTCTAETEAGPGPYRVVLIVTASTSAREKVTAHDIHHYVGVERGTPAIDVEVATNGEDADEAPLVVPTGQPVAWTYSVTNVGEVTLTKVEVTDTRGIAVSCPRQALPAGASMTCTGHGIASDGLYENAGTGTAKAYVEGGVTTVSDTDPSSYYGMHVDTP